MPGPTHRKDGGSIYAELPPHAYDPQTNPELFEGVLARRVVAFIIDLIITVLPLAVAAIFIFFLGLITFGARLGHVLAVVAGLHHLGVVLLRNDAREPGLGDHRHAHHGS